MRTFQYFLGAWASLIILLVPIADAGISGRNRVDLFNSGEFYLDGEENKYFFKWEYFPGTESITFNLEVETEGFVGLGFSSDGCFAGADIFLAWVDSDGLADGLDMHFLDNDGNTVDVESEQSYTLLSGTETDGKTYLRFSRSLDTKDPDDVPITNGPNYIIWLYAQTDALLDPYICETNGTNYIELIKEPTTTTDPSGTTDPTTDPASTDSSATTDLAATDSSGTTDPVTISYPSTRSSTTTDRPIRPTLTTPSTITANQTTETTYPPPNLGIKHIAHYLLILFALLHMLI